MCAGELAELESDNPSAQRSHHYPRNMHLSNDEVSLAEAPLLQQAHDLPKKIRSLPISLGTVPRAISGAVCRAQGRRDSLSHSETPSVSPFNTRRCPTPS